MLGGSDTLATFQMPKFEWVQPTLEFLSPTFTEFLLFIPTLILFIASWRDLRRAMIMNFARPDGAAADDADPQRDRGASRQLPVDGDDDQCRRRHHHRHHLRGDRNAQSGRLGAMAATLNYIPIIGPIATFAILIVVGLVTFPTIGAGLLAPVAFAAVTFLEGHFITPTIVGRRLSLNALAVFMALAFWTWLWGPMGAFLSSPLLIVALIIKEHLMPVDSPQLP